MYQTLHLHERILYYLDGKAGGILQLANGDPMDIEGIGTAALQCELSKEINFSTLNDILYVPDS